LTCLNNSSVLLSSIAKQLLGGYYVRAPVKQGGFYEEQGSGFSYFFFYFVYDGPAWG